MVSIINYVARAVRVGRTLLINSGVFIVIYQNYCIDTHHQLGKR